MKHIEIEYKMLLSKEEYQRLLENIQDKAVCIKQSNIYLDRVDKPLYLDGQALRVRIENDCAYELTLKTKREHDNLEENISLSDAEYKLFLEDPNQIVKRYFPDIGDIKILGQLDNIRYQWQDNGLFALDQSSYFDCIDYEIEYEANDYESKAVLIDFLNLYKIDFKENKETKIQRFSQALLKQ